MEPYTKPKTRCTCERVRRRPGRARCAARHCAAAGLAHSRRRRAGSQHVDRGLLLTPWGIRLLGHGSRIPQVFRSRPRSQCREPSLRPARFWASTTSPISSRHRVAKERRRVYVCTSVRIERVNSTTRSWITYVMRINRLFSFYMHEIIHRLENFVPAATRTAAKTTQQPERPQRFANWIIRRYSGI